jgi:hypothetical protein
MASRAKEVRGIKTQLSVIIMKEGDYFIAYAPALDFSTCGKSVEEAQRMFAEGVNIFLSECVKRGTLQDVLIDCGWSKSSTPRPHLVPPFVVTGTQQEVEIPCLA